MDEEEKRAYYELSIKAEAVGFDNLSENEKNRLRDLHGQYEDEKYAENNRQPNERYVQDYFTAPD